MGVVGNFTVPADSFALEHTLSNTPEITVEADRLASHSTMEVFPFLWVSGGDSEVVERVLEADPKVEDLTVAEETDDENLYRIEWTDEFCGLINEMVDHHAAILEAKASDGEWDLRLRFAEEEMVSEFQNHFRETGRDFEVNNLFHPTEPRQREFGLTTEQHEALVAAVNEGYYAIPRTVSVDELGATLGISANSVSQRIRRGSETLIQTALTVTDDDDAE